MAEVILQLEVFAAANRQVGQVIYAVEIVSFAPGVLVGSSGLPIVPGRYIDDRLLSVDLLLVTGGPKDRRHTLSNAEAAWITINAERAGRYGAIGSGIELLMQAGLLGEIGMCPSGCVSHDHAKLLLQFDALLVFEGVMRLFPGAAAGIDLGLALVEQDCGPDVARAIARDLVVYLKC